MDIMTADRKRTHIRTHGFGGLVTGVKEGEEEEERCEMAWVQQQESSVFLPSLNVSNKYKNLFFLSSSLFLGRGILDAETLQMGFSLDDIERLSHLENLPDITEPVTAEDLGPTGERVHFARRRVQIAFLQQRLRAGKDALDVGAGGLAVFLEENLGEHE